MQWLVSFLKSLFKNPALMLAVAAEVEADASLPQEEKDIFAAVSGIGTAWANKKSGTVVFHPSDGSGDTTLANLTF